jgi:hypothetical protein
VLMSETTTMMTFSMTEVPLPIRLATGTSHIGFGGALIVKSGGVFWGFLPAYLRSV